MNSILVVFVFKVTKIRLVEKGKELNFKFLFQTLKCQTC